MKFAITCSLYNRPIYTKIILEKLAQCELAEEIHLYVRIDPSKYSDTILELANNYPHAKTIIHNKTRLGCSLNIYSAIKDGFDSGVDQIIHIEDDIFVSKDSLKYFKEAAQEYKDDPTIFSINGYNRDTILRTKEDLNLYEPRGDWNCWGWSIGRSKWDFIKSKWAFGEKSSGQSWDVQVKKIILLAGYKGVFPYVNKILNIGRENGTYCTPEVFDKKHLKITNFSDNFE